LATAWGWNDLRGNSKLYIYDVEQGQSVSKKLGKLLQASNVVDSYGTILDRSASRCLGTAETLFLISGTVPPVRTVDAKGMLKYNGG
jgi:hypothetical protein